MQIESLALPAVILIAVTSLVLLSSLDWRLSIIALAIQYIGAFVLVSLHWPMEMAVAKLVAGWMAGAVLGMAMAGMPQLSQETDAGGQAIQKATQPLPGVYFLTGRPFRLIAALLVGLTVLSISPQALTWASGIEIEQMWGGLTLIGMGLLHLGFTARPLSTVLGLLTLLAGFEILYAAVETSTLVAGLLAAVNLGIALVGAYLLVAPQMEAVE